MPVAPKIRLVRAETVVPILPRAAPTLDEAFREHAPYLARVALRVLGRRDEVEDLVQQTFIEACSSLKNLRNPDAIRAFLAAITVRLARRTLRVRRLKQWVLFDDAPDYLDVADARHSAVDRVLLAKVYEVLDTLPADERIAWALQYIEGEALERVASLCQCSLATVKRRVARAQAAIERGTS
jgi:RNA polymerase sigma-70 factor (ECF subfamily)